MVLVPFDLYLISHLLRTSLNKWQDAIAGKCRVICTLQDERNPHPSQADIERADFVFSRLFDASTCTLSDELPPPATIASHNSMFLCTSCNLTWYWCILVLHLGTHQGHWCIVTKYSLFGNCQRLLEYATPDISYLHSIILRDVCK